MVEYIHYSEPEGPKLYKIGKYSFSTIEIKHLAIALLMITLTMMALQDHLLRQIGIVSFTILFFITVGLGFLLHELGHKLVAQYYGFVSEFRGDFFMMFVALILAFSGFTFLAPGAVVILGRVSVRQNGIISVAGPVVNLILALIFILIGLLFNPTGFLEVVVYLGIWINAFLGLFNMLPFWILDGKKVLAWNKTVYFSVFGALVLILFGHFTGVFV